jgi:hypothetical protein
VQNYNKKNLCRSRGSLKWYEYSLLLERCVAWAVCEVKRIEFRSIRILFGQVLFGQNGLYRTFWDTCTAVNAGIWIDIVPRPFIFGNARDNTFHRAHFNTSAVANAQVENYMSHETDLLWIAVAK